MCVAQRRTFHAHCYKTAVFYIYVRTVLPQSTAEIQILPVLKINAKLESHFRFLALLSLAACDSASAYPFIQISWSTTKLWCDIDFPTWRQQRHESMSGSGLVTFHILTRSKTICLPNFDCISQSTAEILLLPVSENKRQPYWNSTSGFDYDLVFVISVWFCVGRPNFVGIGQSAPVAMPWLIHFPSYNVITIFKMAIVSHVWFTLG